MFNDTHEIIMRGIAKEPLFNKSGLFDYSKIVPIEIKEEDYKPGGCRYEESSDWEKRYEADLHKWITWNWDCKDIAHFRPLMTEKIDENRIVFRPYMPMPRYLMAKLSEKYPERIVIVLKWEGFERHEYVYSGGRQIRYAYENNFKFEKFLEDAKKNTKEIPHTPILDVLKDRIEKWALETHPADADKDCILRWAKACSFACMECDIPTEPAGVFAAATDEEFRLLLRFLNPHEEKGIRKEVSDYHGLGNDPGLYKTTLSYKNIGNLDFYTDGEFDLQKFAPISDVDVKSHGGLEKAREDLWGVQGVKETLSVTQDSVTFLTSGEMPMMALKYHAARVTDLFPESMGYDLYPTFSASSRGIYKNTYTSYSCGKQKEENTVFGLEICDPDEVPKKTDR